MRPNAWAVSREHLYPPMHPHMVCPPLLDMVLSYIPRLGVSHRANTILEVVLPFIGIGGESTMEDKI